MLGLNMFSFHFHASYEQFLEIQLILPSQEEIMLICFPFSG